MIKKLLLMVMISLPLTLVPATVTGQSLTPASEDEQTRLVKDEITRLMIQIGRMLVLQQESKMDTIWTGQPGSKTPRSDFLFCSGFAYLGNYKAQACLGYAYENGKGVVKDLSEAYVWYSIALGTAIGEKATQQKLQSDRDRVKRGLFSTYPAPTEEELDDLVKSQKQRILLYLAEIRNTRL